MVALDPPRVPEAGPLEASLLDLLAEVDAEGNLTTVSGEAQLLFGWSAEELCGRPLVKLLLPAERERLEALLERVAQGETPPPKELGFRHRHGWEVWLEVAMRPLSGRPGALLGARDVTIRRRGEIALEESRERYRLLFERSPVGVIHYDCELRISDCNESFRRILRASYEQLIGLDMRQLKDQRVIPALQAALDGGQGAYEGPYETTISDLHLWVSLRTVPFHGPQGEVQGGICLLEDITERKQAEEAQRATYEISEAVHDTDDLRELFHSIHAVLARLMPADNVYFALYDRPTDTVTFPYFVDRYDPPPPARRGGAGLTEQAIHGGQPLLLSTRGEIERWFADRGVVVHGTIPESWLGVPLRRGQETIGLLALQSYDHQVTFGERQRDMLAFVASQVAMAIERKRHEEQIEHMAFFDGLTGLYNRRMLQVRSQQSLELARRHNWSVAFLYLDLDRFKNVNDTLGHEAGDELLAAIGGELKTWLRASDTVARLGGDEFGFVLNAADERRAGEAAQRLLGILDRPFEVRRERVRVGASIGIALFPQHGETFDELLKHADIAMYRAKVEGSSYRFFDPERSPFSRERLALESELRDALAAGELELHYQPLLALVDGSLVGFEALARWQRRESMMAAAEFVPVAEGSELVRLLDWQLLSRALHETQELMPAGSTLQVASNLSARSLHSAGLVEHLAAILDETGITPERVVLEVTENAAVSDPERCSRTLHMLAELGVRLALDDFGTGLASLTHLRAMPFHRVKIDGSLIREIGFDPRAEELVRVAIGLGHGLGLEVVGEGVESEAQRQWLRGRGCDLVQGHLVGRPVAASELHGLSRMPRDS